MRQVAGDTVAHVHERVDQPARGEPAAFGEARLEIEMFAGERSAELAGDEEGVARARAGPQQRAAARHRRHDRHAEQQTSGIRRGLAADHGDLVLRGETAQSAVDREDALRVVVLRQRQRDHRRHRRPAHRGDIAEAPRERLPADALGIGVGGEVDAFDHGVGLEQRLRAGGAELQHRAIVAGAGHHEIVRGQQRLQLRDQFEFGHRKGPVAAGCVARLSGSRRARCPARASRTARG